MTTEERLLLSDLFEIRAIQFGEFTLKDGRKSPIYIDLRLLVGYPSTLAILAELMDSYMREHLSEYRKIAAIPMAGLPIGTALIMVTWDSRPLGMVYHRRQKGHGTKAKVEGVYSPGDTILLVDDLITSGGSKIEAIEALGVEGIEVKDVLVAIDREQGGKEDLESAGYSLHSLFTITEMMEFYLADGFISQEIFDEVMSYIRNS